VTSLTYQYPNEDDRAFYMTLDGRERSAYVNNATRSQCPCFVIGADRRLSYQLSFASKYTFLAKLTRRFHEQLSESDERVKRLQLLFSELRSTFEEVESFSSFVHELKVQLEEMSSGLAYGLNIDFAAYNPSNYFRSLRVSPIQGGEARELDELGTGQEQILALSFAYAYARAFHGVGNLMLVIEEPEAHLHPLAQRWVGRKLRELASLGLQIVVTTHSAAFLDIMGLEGLALVTKQDGVTSVMQLSNNELAEYCRKRGAPKANRISILPFYAAAATDEILSAFFARRIVLVEGPTEALAIPAYLERIGVLTDTEGVAVVSVGGVGSVARWWRLFSAYGIPTYAVFDNDASKHEDPDHRKRGDILSALGVDSRLHAQLTRTDEWVIDEKFCIFGVDFETIMRWYFDDYEQLEHQAVEELGMESSRSKPLVARYVAQRVDIERSPEGAKRLATLGEAILSLR
jgi:putative ATP-dependent endonuclease of OLD family